MTESAPTGPISFSELSRMPMTRLKSVGAGKRSESFAKFGVENLLDLLTHYPRRWIDRTKEATIASAVEGTDSLVIGEVRSVSSPPKGARRGPSRVTATIADGSGRLSIVFFNQPWRERQLKVGSYVAVFG
ncbi:MAG: OB-fold nucleic acid binding domain-containing protein, partial [Ilumatobacteraceae bacterium]|nr:OB-fold nucleic acid binding domain-containing protein [Ilumatobacteraceae bacterium]